MTTLPTETNPQVIKLRFSYGPIIQQIIAANGCWQPIDPESLAGRIKSNKQKSLWQAAASRGVKIQTTFQADGFLYARVVTEAPDATLPPAKTLSREDYLRMTEPVGPPRPQYDFDANGNFQRVRG